MEQHKTVKVVEEDHSYGKVTRILLPSTVGSNEREALTTILNSSFSNKHIIFDARHTSDIDDESLALIKEFVDNEAKNQELLVNVYGEVTGHEAFQFEEVVNADVQSSLNAESVLKLLIQGNQRYVSQQSYARYHRHDVNNSAHGQHPMAIVLGCIDSLEPVETVFDLGVGDVFSAQVAGNVVNEDILGSMEYSCQVAGAKLIVVLGHTECGVVKAACDSVELGNITHLLSKVKPAIAAETSIRERNSKNSDFVKRVTSLNIANTVKEVYQKSELLKHLIDDKSIGIVGATYDVGSGQVHFEDYSKEVEKVIPADNSFDFAGLELSLAALGYEFNLSVAGSKK